MNDPEIRARLYPLLRGGVHIDELPTGSTRADVVHITEHFMHGYEVKGDGDTLQRVENQLRCYAEVYDFVTFVVTEKHLAKLLPLPACVGGRAGGRRRRPYPAPRTARPATTPPCSARRMAGLLVGRRNQAVFAGAGPGRGQHLTPARGGAVPAHGPHGAALGAGPVRARAPYGPAARAPTIARGPPRRGAPGWPVCASGGWPGGGGRARGAGLSCVEFCPYPPVFMPATTSSSPTALPRLPKLPTGIEGLDEITEGGLPLGRPTLLCGSAGCGKTLMAIEFLVRGVEFYNEPGVLMTFEETADELAANVASLGFDLRQMQADKLLRLDHVHLDRSEMEESGEYDLDGLFIRLGYAIDAIGAKRVVLDTIEALFSGFTNQAVLRSEIRRLFRWLKDKGVTTIITAERGDGTLTRQGLEEYVSDCVILLDNRVIEQITTRRLRIVKYRGSTHGTNEYPYLISEDGISVLPVTSCG
ncbi:MAG: ATPase domain-containing protein [Hymenobacter sp.]